MKRGLGNLDPTEVDVEYWLNALQEGSVNIASDGSVAKGKGYYALLLKMKDRQLQFQGPCDCDPQLVSSYRAELMGILALYYLLDVMAEHHQTKVTHNLIIHVDNSAAVRTSNKDIPPGIRSHLTTNIDIIQEIQRMKQNGPLIEAEWVKAHQDNTESFNDLPLEAQMNCLADQDVTNFCHNTPPQLEPTTTPLLFPPNKAFMKINNRHITNNLEHNLQDNLPSCNI